MARPKLQKSILSLKSWLFTPATKSDRFTRAADVHSDALIIDLEDAVAPSAKTGVAHGSERVSVLTMGAFIAVIH
jgi:HpcH/HpaI aldolase/citrate lyase family